MLRTRHAGAWLLSLPTWPQVGHRPQPMTIITDGEIPPAPDEVAIVSIGPGTPTSMERTFDTHSLQVRVRGPQVDPDGAEDLMAAVDNGVMGAVAPVVIGGRRVIDIDYAGGPPQFLLRDEARRVHLVCNYLITITREVT